MLGTVFEKRYGRMASFSNKFGLPVPRFSLCCVISLLLVQLKRYFVSLDNKKKAVLKEFDSNKREENAGGSILQPSCPKQVIFLISI